LTIGAFSVHSPRSHVKEEIWDEPGLAQKLEEDGMSKRRYIGGMMVGTAILLTASALIASNMGFKLNYALTQPGTAPVNGNNTIALPDNRQTGMNTAKSLMDDVGLASVTQVQRFIKATNTYGTYFGRAPSTAANDFPLVAGEGYLIRMKTSVNYIIVGSDEPALGYSLTQPGVAPVNGNNFYAYNYHQTAGTAKQMMDDIGLASVTQVQRFIKSSNTYGTYFGRAPSLPANDFALAPGEAYLIRMKTTVSYTPSHY
jgi:hypothetical protein